MRDRDRRRPSCRLGLKGYVGGPGGLIADFAAAFAGIDGILLGVALLVVLVILLIVYRSPILPFAVLLSAVFGLSAASLVVYQLALNDVITLSGQSQGILFILVVGAVHRLRAAARQPLQGGAARPAELVGRAQARLARLGRADRRVGRDRHPRPALPAARRAAQHLRPGPGRRPRHRRRAAGVADLPARGPPAASAARCSGRSRPSSTTCTPRTSSAPRASGAASPTWSAGTRGAPGSSRSPCCSPPRRSRRRSRPTAPRIDETFLDDTDSIIAQQVIGEHFPAGSATPVQIIVPAGRRRGRAAGRRPSDPGVDSAYIGLVPPQPGQPAGAAEGRRRQRAGAGHDQGGLRQPGGRGHRAAGCAPTSTPSAPTLLVGGNAATNLDVHEASERDLRVIVPTILLVIFLVLALLLRSIVAPLLLVAANVLSFAATIGISALVFQHVFGFAEQRPVDRALRVRLPRGARHRLLDLPDDPGARGGQDARAPDPASWSAWPSPAASSPARASFSRRRSRRWPCCPLVFLVQIAFIVALRRAARHLRGALAARAGVGLRHRAADLVAAPPGGRPASRDRARERGARRVALDRVLGCRA